MAKEIKEEVTAGMDNPAPAEQPTLRKLREKIKARYSDADPKTDEEWMELEDKYAEDVEGELSKYKDADMTIQEVMMVDETFGMLLYDVGVNKMPLRAALAKYFSQEDLIPAEGDPDYPDFETVKKEKQAEKERKSTLDAQIEANELASIANLDKIAEEKGLSEEEKNSLLEFVNNTFSEMMMKNIPESIWDAFHKAMNYDKDVQAAKEEGEIAGRNTAIELKKANSAQKMDDGIPMAGKGGETSEPKPSRIQEIFKGIGERKGL